jgi:hypothetical protein
LLIEPGLPGKDLLLRYGQARTVTRQITEQASALAKSGRPESAEALLQMAGA